MKPRIRTSFLFSLLIVFCDVSPSIGQTLSILHTFSGIADGWHPVAPLVLSGNTLYGTVQRGGISNCGTIFRINTDGTGFSTLHQFSGGEDGSDPVAGLVLSADTLYGTTEGGTVFAIKTDGMAFRVLHTFVLLTTATNTDGARPVGGLVLSGNTLYGTASGGGPSASGTIFKVNTDGSGFATLYNFSAADGFINSDGAAPYGRLVLSGRTLYGTTYFGGAGGNGTVFAINIDGSDFKPLYSFAEGGNWQFHNFINEGGSNPRAGLVLAGETLYGTAENGGKAQGGTAFKINTNGSGFATLYDLVLTNDVGHPYGGLAWSGETLYGAAGKVFAVNTNGSSYTEIYSFPFTNVSNGWSPAELIVSGNTLYGVASGGGGFYDGTIFSISVPPLLKIVQAAGMAILTWPTTYAGFDYTHYSLQSSTNLSSPDWRPLALVPSIINGQNVITNPISTTDQFFRLTQ